LAGGGSIQGMIISLRNNKNLLRPKRSFLNQRKEFLKAAKGEVNFRKASKEELELFRKKIYKERKRQRKIDIAIWSGVGVILLFATILLTKTMTEEIRDSEKERFKIQMNDYLKLIEYGDEWLTERRWHNAIFTYKKALEIFPKEYDINYRLTYALCLRCEADFINCKEAKTKLDKLLLQYPNRNELLELRKILNYEYE
jgi:tetratricopeptide (TPR) repeat protein